MSFATPPSLDVLSPPRRSPGPFAERLGELGRRIGRRHRGIALSGRLQRLLISVLLVEQAITLLVLWLDGAGSAKAVHVLVPLGSVLASLAVLALVMLIRDLRREATTDPLTGALNRSGFEHRLKTRCPARRSFGQRSRHVLAAFDLDGFKGVNDTFGHAAGDGVLREIVRRMRASAPRGSLIGRLGGDEFVLELRLGRDAPARGVVEAIRASLVARPVVVDGVAHAIGVTAGVAIREPGEPVEAALTRADLALVAGKLHAKNRSYAALPTARRAGSAEPDIAPRPRGRRVT